METMGFEPTTPCLQTVRLVVVIGTELAPRARGAAPGDRFAPDCVAPVWPGPAAPIRRQTGELAEFRTESEPL